MTETEKIERETLAIKVWLPCFKVRVAFENLVMVNLLLKIQMRKEIISINKLRPPWIMFQQQLQAALVVSTYFKPK